jgi:hypothetical protein
MNNIQCILTPLLKKRIKQCIGMFDIKALFDLLAYLGVDSKNIIFEGHYGNESQPRFIKSIDFIDKDNKVIITLYFGMSGAMSTLPSYIFKMAEEGYISETHFHDLLRLFDRIIIRDWLKAVYPEALNMNYIFNHDRTFWLRSVHSLSSLSSLNWLFQLTLPELQLRTKRHEFVNANQAVAAKLGSATLGVEMVLGNSFNVINNGYHVTYISDDEYYYDEPWHFIVQERLAKLVFPLLANFDLMLEIWLVIRKSSKWVSLEHKNYLGYNRLKDDHSENKSILIYSGIPTNRDSE